MPSRNSVVGRITRNRPPSWLGRYECRRYRGFRSHVRKIESLFGHNLKAARLCAGLSQQDLAARAGVALAFLTQIENGVSDPDLQVIGALAKAVGCAAYELLKS
jgi:DNA-binding XRE family transcriptional regulator